MSTSITPSLSYRLGQCAGTLVREVLRSARNTHSLANAAAQHHVEQSIAQRAPILPLPVLMAAEVEELDRVPALVRRQGIDLNIWFMTNTHEARPEKPKRIRTPRKAKPALAVPSDQAAQSASPRKLHLGSLDQLIAPVRDDYDVRLVNPENGDIFSSLDEIAALGR